MMLSTSRVAATAITPSENDSRRPVLTPQVSATNRSVPAVQRSSFVCHVPMLAVGPPAYPISWGHATLLALIGCTVAGSLWRLTRETQLLTRRLREEAVIDDLTGLLNRRGWRYAAPRELARSSRSGVPIA